MSIQLLSISHKTAPLEIRELFAYDDEQKIKLLQELNIEPWIEEAIVLATCNRTEVYVKTQDSADDIKTLSIIKKHVLKISKADCIPNMNDYILMYQNNNAINHIFKVASGFDSMVIGEDQILGQVKQAADFAQRASMCGTYLNTMFRYAVTAAKKIKTETSISKTSVSTATLALKAAEEKLGTLKDKNILIIGASGKIGGIVFKNASCIKGAHIYATKRNHTIEAEPMGHADYKIVAYEDRYLLLEDIDVIISATSGPHYTISKDKVSALCKTVKPRVYVDLAVPMDIDPEISDLPDTYYYNIEDMKQLAHHNNEKKLADMSEAERIMNEEIEDFLMWRLFRNHIEDMKTAKKLILKDASEHSTDEALDHMFYRLREAGSSEEISGFFEALIKMNEEWSKKNNE